MPPWMLACMSFTFFRDLSGGVLDPIRFFH
jgi:hypothetical protein